jgi:hypothetical protein
LTCLCLGCVKWTKPSCFQEYDKLCTAALGQS